jgi:hypothetical protein
MIFKGFIAKISKKEGRSSKGRAWSLYSIKLEKEDGSEYDKWISAGFDPPDAKEGDYVKITAEENDQGYINATDIKRLKNAPARSGKAATGGAGNNVSNTTQKSIHYQSARKDAIEVLKLLVSQDALPLTAAKGKAGEAKRYLELMALVDKLAIRYFFDAETHRLLEAVVDEGAVKADVGKLPEDSDDDEEQDDEEGEDDSDDEEDDE